MSLFNSILEKLGLKKTATETVTAKPAASVSQPAPQVTAAPPPAPQIVNDIHATAQAVPETHPAPQAAPVPPSFPQFVPGLHPAPQAMPVPDIGPAVHPAAIPPAAAAAIPVVDVVSKLEHLAAANPEKLNWKVSIVDLLKLLGIDSSFAARKELAIELGCPADKMNDSAQMNTWLHKIVLQKLAENGGNIPKELLD
jgi:hypothetical protein